MPSNVAWSLAYILAVAALIAGDQLVDVVITTQASSHRLTPESPIPFCSHACPRSNATFRLTVGHQTYQTMEGWGGAFTESAALVLSELNRSLYDEVMDAYFGPDGLQYTFGRVPMGSCDFSPVSHPWSYDDVAGDLNLSSFSIDRDRNLRLPLIKDASGRRAASNATLRLLGSPWSAPGWMKTNKDMICNTEAIFKDCVLDPSPAVHAAYAQYFARWIRAYTAEGLEVWGVTVQNEPQENLYTYEGMKFSPEQERDFIRDHLGPALAVDPVANATRILFLDHNKDHLPAYAPVVLGDPGAAKYVWGAGVHWYTGDHFDDLAAFHANFSTFSLLATEATAVRDTKMAPLGGTWARGEHYAHDMFGDFNNWVTGFIDWNLALDRKGGPLHIGPIVGDLFGSDSMMICDLKATPQRVYKQASYYYVGHFSKFVPVGSRRLEWHLDAAPDGFECTAFVTPDETVVVVAMNAGDVAVTFELADGAKSADVTLPGHSIVTLRYHR